MRADTQVRPYNSGTRFAPTCPTARRVILSPDSVDSAIAPIPRGDSWIGAKNLVPNGAEATLQSGNNGHYADIAARFFVVPTSRDSSE